MIGANSMSSFDRPQACIGRKYPTRLCLDLGQVAKVANGRSAKRSCSKEAAIPFPWPRPAPNRLHGNNKEFLEIPCLNGQLLQPYFRLQFEISLLCYPNVIDRGHADACPTGPIMVLAKSRIQRVLQDDN